MDTLDEFIERRQELREVADKGGETPVALRRDWDDLEPDFETAAAELTFVECSDGDPLTWECLRRPRLDGGADQVLSIY